MRIIIEALNQKSGSKQIALSVVNLAISINIKFKVNTPLLKRVVDRLVTVLPTIDNVSMLTLYLDGTKGFVFRSLE